MTCPQPMSSTATTRRGQVYIGLAWLWVAVPFAYGVFELLLKVKQLLQ
ncbi:MFS transporter small subunit [Mycobacterium sp. URHB0021]|jgi:hypothetical protein